MRGLEATGLGRIPRMEDQVIHNTEFEAAEREQEAAVSEEQFETWATSPERSDVLKALLRRRAEVDILIDAHTVLVGVGDQLGSGLAMADLARIAYELGREDGYEEGWRHGQWNAPNGNQKEEK